MRRTCSANVCVALRPQVRCLVDYPGEKLPSVTGGELEWYLLDTVAPQVRGRLLVIDLFSLS